MVVIHHPGYFVDSFDFIIIRLLNYHTLYDFRFRNYASQLGPIWLDVLDSLYYTEVVNRVIKDLPGGRWTHLVPVVWV